MTQARSTLVSIEQTPYYHCVGRCVRRAFLCGNDQGSGRSYGHRRAWMQQRLALLCEIFAVDLCAYALMSNHYHLVVKLCPERTRGWSDKDVIDRWLRVYSAPLIVQRYRNSELISAAQREAAANIVSQWRERLADLSWFMKCLNEYIARRANREDGVTGHFWEARFKSQALLDDIALLQGMVYTDLNPIRAAMATSINNSAYTSARQRFRALMGLSDDANEAHSMPRLAAFQASDETPDGSSLPFSLEDYLTLVDTTGRCCIQGKQGFTNEALPRLLCAGTVNPERWLEAMLDNNGSAGRAIGAPHKLKRFAEAINQRWLRGLNTVAALYSG